MSPTQRTWAEVSARCGRNDLPVTLFRANFDRLLSSTELAKGIAEAWTSAEWPARSASPELWAMLFKSAAPDATIDDEGNSHPHSELPDLLTLYRGCWPRYKRGMSFTDDLDTAVWFAHRFDVTGRTGRVYQARVPRSLVLGRFDRRGEHEFVIDVLALAPRAITVCTT